MTTQPLADLTVFDLKRAPAIIFKDEKLRANGMLHWAFIMMFIGVAIGIVGKMLLHQDIVTVVGVLVSLAGMFFVAYPFLAPAPRKKYDPALSSHEEVLTQSPPAKYLPQERNVEYVSSITERTTDLLKVGPTTRQRQREDEE